MSASISPQSFIHPKIDVFAQKSLIRLSKGDAAAQSDASGMLNAVKTGQLDGIYKEDLKVPALAARKLGTNWWELIPEGEDAALIVDVDQALNSAPFIVFQKQVKSDPGRLDPALREAWTSFQRLQAGDITLCSLIQPSFVLTSVAVGRAAASTGQVLNIVPPVFCQLQSTRSFRAELERKFGIHIRDGNASWRAADLVDLNKALKFLSKKEQSVVRGYHFLRTQSIKKSHPDSDSCARHTQAANTLRIEMGDACMPQPHMRGSIWVGPQIKETIHAGAFNILHEMGHAMEASENRKSGTKKGTILKQFVARDNPRKLLTSDKRKAPAERFAEAFAVFRANPDHLKKDFAKLFTWFKGGHHCHQLP